jgi:hypothetical protein
VAIGDGASSSSIHDYMFIMSRPHHDLNQDSCCSLLMMAQLMFTSINNSIHGQQQNQTTNDTQQISQLNEWLHNIHNSIFSCICGAAATTTDQSNKFLFLFQIKKSFQVPDLIAEPALF